MSWDVDGRRCISHWCIQSIIVALLLFWTLSSDYKPFEALPQSFPEAPGDSRSSRGTLAANQRMWKTLDTVGRKDDKWRKQRELIFLFSHLNQRTRVKAPALFNEVH